MESTRPIRALMRGLDALTVLNLRDGATVSEVAQEIRLPRTTVYRILETLCNAGFVFRDAADDRYRLTILVRGLSDGFDDEAWVTQIAKPFINDLCREIVWPVSIATLSGTMMLVRESTDHSSPLAIERNSAGFRAPLMTTAAGRVYLANSPPPQRETLIDILARSNKEEDKPARARADLVRALGEIKSSGYAAATRTRRLTVRFATSAVPLRTGVERFLPKLRQCADNISSLFSEQQTEARAKHPSETAV
jgi:IclR family mhp operon transcriptional activator